MSPSEATVSVTGTTAAAREHARSMEGSVVETMPTLPPAHAPDRPAGVEPGDVLWDEVVAGGGYTHLTVGQGTLIRLRDREGDACAGLLLHRHGHPSERLNVADTVKVQWQAYLREGQLLLSDMGRALATVVADSSGRHDTICGTSNRAANDRRYGTGAVEGIAPNGRDLFALALAKNGRTRRDLAPNVNFFKGTRVDPNGALRLLESAGAGTEVVLRCELDVLVTIVNVAHPLDDRSRYTVTPLGVTAWRPRPGSSGLPDRAAAPEAARAYLNNDAANGLHEKGLWK